MQPRFVRRFEVCSPRPTARCSGVTREPWLGARALGLRLGVKGQG